MVNAPHMDGLYAPCIYYNRSFAHLSLLAAFRSKFIGVLQQSASAPLLESLSMNL